MNFFLKISPVIIQSWEVERITQTGCVRKTWWDSVKDDVENLGLLSQKDAQFRNKWKRIKGATG